MKKPPRSYSLERDRIEAWARLVAVSIVTPIVWLTVGDATGVLSTEQYLMKYGIFIYIAGACAVVADLKLRPSYSLSRNVLGIGLDVAGVSAGLYLAAGSVDPLALFYLWIILGSGMVYGVRYLFLAAALSISGFGFVYWASPYWQSQTMFSATIAGLIVLLGPYMATLLRSLERTREQVNWQADHDGLTGILNRRAFERELTNLEMSRESNQTHFLLYMDLDKFKDINDQAGHAAGDQALVEIVKFLKAGTGKQDLVARMGGDEFCLLMVNRSLEDARRRAERIRSDVASYRLPWGTRYYSLGVSVGVACSLSVVDGRSLIRLADAACYAAKNNGRNQVHVVDIHSKIVDTQVIRRLVLQHKSDSDPATAVCTAHTQGTGPLTE